uniref:Uncharacterized protein n=1 Tax=Meloidogyne enterolobii TaxID=390850 RepID=A0A6V7UF04_MELEN|nr:unnamed protein product [Meloidogyne enterolobii]
MWQLKTLIIFKCLLFLCETIKIDFADYALKLEEKLNEVKNEIQSYERLMVSIRKNGVTDADNVNGLLLNASDDFNFVVKGEQLNEQTNTENVIKLDIISEFIGNIKNSKNAENLIELQDSNNLPKQISVPEVLSELDKLMIKETEKQILVQRMAKLEELTRYRKQINSIVKKTKKEFYFVQDTQIFENIGIRIFNCIQELDLAFGKFMKSVINDKKEEIKNIIEKGKKKFLTKSIKEKLSKFKAFGYNHMETTSEEKNLFYIVDTPQRKHLKFVKADLTDKIKEKANLIKEIKNLKHQIQLKPRLINEMKKLMLNTSHKGDEFNELNAKIEALETKIKKLELYIEIYKQMNIIVDGIYDNINKLYSVCLD